MKQEKYIDYDIKYHIVLKTKENISNKSTIINIRKLIIEECNNINVDIIKACISNKYVHLFLSTSPDIIISNFVKKVKKSTNQILNKNIWLDG